MSMLWLTTDLVDAMGGRPIGAMPEGVTGISIDTRSLQPGDAFFAIKGETMDGHDFATAAVKAGAGLLVVAEGKLPALGRLTAPMIVVPDVLVALERAGIAARARTKARSSRSPVRPARPAPRRRCATRCRRPARCMRRTSRSTITGACR